MMHLTFHILMTKPDDELLRMSMKVFLLCGRISCWNCNGTAYCLTDDITVAVSYVDMIMSRCLDYITSSSGNSLYSLYGVTHHFCSSCNSNSCKNQKKS